jgi:sigma-B regulation protein RsbQ
MDIQSRNNVRFVGDGPITLVMAHGFGCDQEMWRLLVPRLTSRCRMVLFDYVGCGGSDLGQYDADKYAKLDGYAQDLLDVASIAGDGPLVLVAHSVSAMVGVIADRRSPGCFQAHVMIGPSPAYINDQDYEGGFDQADIEELLETLEANYLGWAAQMGPTIMGAPDQPQLSDELTDSLCRTDPHIAARFARATFLTNNRPDLPYLSVPALVLQSSEDVIAPRVVGAHVARTVPNATLRLIDNIGHCPHISVPDACALEIERFLTTLPIGHGARKEA